jgi:hypothetical protein
MEMSYADYLKEQGREEIRSQMQSYGEHREEQGEARGMRSALETVLMERFGKVPRSAQQAIATADLDTLNDWLRAALRAKTLKEVGIRSPQ